MDLKTKTASKFIRLCTVDNKIIRAFEIIHVKKLIPNAILRNKYLSNHDD